MAVRLRAGSPRSRLEHTIELRNEPDNNLLEKLQNYSETDWKTDVYNKAVFMSWESLHNRVRSSYAISPRFWPSTLDTSRILLLTGG